MGDLLATCGAINWDISLFVKRFPEPGEEVRVERIERVPGGTAANVAVAAARILGPGRVAFLGALGGDEIANRQIEELRREGIITDAIKVIEGEESGQAYIVVDSTGQNVIHTYFGANLRVDAEYVKSDPVREIVERCRVVVIMDPPLEAADALARLARESEATVIWDPGVYVDRGLRELARVMRNVDYFVLNEVETRNLLGSSDPSSIASKMAEVSPGAKFIVKLGARGSMLVDASTGRWIRVGAPSLERLGMRVVNTVGCGDAFIGALAASKYEDLDDAESLVRANAAGALKATRLETRGSPTREELLSFLERAREMMEVQEG
ncbi:MAG: PfkB family carbohydrate kinase [Candidatus Korarchaeota archaeon]|nr:PfkB family carbohydrate kinase [Candidatus Korarchaeota archaeon]